MSFFVLVPLYSGFLKRLASNVLDCALMSYV